MKINIIKKTVILLIWAASFTSSVCYALDGETYFGVGLGKSSLDLSDPSADKIDDSDTYLKIFGGKRINESMNIEFGYVKFGEYSAHYPAFDETDKADASALFASVVGKANVANNISVIGRIGLDYWIADISAKATVLGVPVSGSGDGSGISLFFGFGMEMAISSKSAIRLEFERYNNVADGIDVTFPGFGSTEVDGEDVDLMGVSILHNF